MTPTGQELEESVKEQFREIFYEEMARRISAANDRSVALLFDFVRGKHSLQDVIFGVPPTSSAVKPLIYPLRTYELIHELESKGEPA